MRLEPAANTPTIRLRSPGEVVSAVPYLLGFSPDRSLVVIGLSGRRVVLTCRVDLSDVVDDRCSGSVVEALGRVAADRVLIVAYDTERQRTEDALASMTGRLEPAGVRVLERISVVGDRWFDEGCTDERCCPPGGVPVIDHDAAPSTMSLHAVSGGFRRDRAVLVAECHPDSPLLTAAIRSELVQSGRGPRPGSDEVASALRAVLGWGSGRTASAADLALATLAVGDPLVRDVCYALVAPAMMGSSRPDLRDLHRSLRRAGALAGDLDRAGGLRDGDARERVLDRLLGWVRNLPDDLPSTVMPALVLASTAHWCAGDGARARILVERARALDAVPLPMLETLTACLNHGVPPAELGRVPRPRPRRGRVRRITA